MNRRFKFAIKKNYGFSLVEIVVAIAILGVIVVVLLNSIVSGYVWIVNSGNRTKAIAEAQKVIEAMYSDGVVDNSNQDSNLYGLLGDKGKVDSASLNNSLFDSTKPDENIFYAITPKIINSETYNQVTVLVFYQSGKQTVKLTAILP